MFSGGKVRGLGGKMRDSGGEVGDSDEVMSHKKEGSAGRPGPSTKKFVTGLPAMAAAMIGPAKFEIRTHCERTAILKRLDG